MSADTEWSLDELETRLTWLDMSSPPGQRADRDDADRWLADFHQRF